ncbi:MAG: hypothetical protein HYX69_03285 [Planctomycetia bacterium]|nr:hypothetical protein [Planctomycetia bacterium]
MKKRNDLAWAIMAIGIVLLASSIVTLGKLNPGDINKASAQISVASLGLLLVAYGAIRLMRHGQKADVIACPACGRKNSVHTKICPRCGQRFDSGEG